MADDSDQQSLNNKANDQPDPSNEIIPVEDAESIAPIQQTENMEIHKHPHHVTHKKKWGEYLLEFFMLFLAVFLGFMAENAREHSVENKRAKVYAANLYEELKKDTVSLNNAIEGSRLVAGKLDTFCLYSTDKEKLDITNGMLYYYSSYTTLLWVYTSGNTTIEELKSSGNLRIMGNDIPGKINAYGKLLSELENEYAEFARIEELYFKIFDGYKSQLLTRGTKTLSMDSIFKLDIPLVNDDPKLMKEFTGWQKYEVGIYQRQIKIYLLPVKQTATEILALLKKEYDLE